MRVQLSKFFIFFLVAFSCVDAVADSLPEISQTRRERLLWLGSEFLEMAEGYRSSRLLSGYAGIGSGALMAGVGASQVGSGASNASTLGWILIGAGAIQVGLSSINLVVASPMEVSAEKFARIPEKEPIEQRSKILYAESKLRDWAASGKSARYVSGGSGIALSMAWIVYNASQPAVASLWYPYVIAGVGVAGSVAMLFLPTPAEKSLARYLERFGGYDSSGFSASWSFDFAPLDGGARVAAIARF